VPKGHIPIRPCISCGAKRSKKDLVRFAVGADGIVRFDERGAGWGRGAYVCSTQACIEKIGTGNRLYRAFRKKEIRFN
jgi:predicted RNA-binding protein YlxR (DUF448 family)